MPVPAPPPLPPGADPSRPVVEHAPLPQQVLRRPHVVTGVLCAALVVPLTALGTAPATAAVPLASSSTAGAPVASATYSWPTLRTGSTGVDVRTAQHLLRERGVLDRTTRAVRAVQRASGLPADGIADRTTWRVVVARSRG